MKEYYLNVRDIACWKETVNAGDKIYLSGTVYTARDAAHKRIFEILNKNSSLFTTITNAKLDFAKLFKALSKTLYPVVITSFFKIDFLL